MSGCQLCEDCSEQLVKEIEASVIDMIRKQRPEWVESDGTCEKCVSYYQNLDKAIEQEN